MKFRVWHALLAIFLMLISVLVYRLTSGEIHCKNN